MNRIKYEQREEAIDAVDTNAETSDGVWHEIVPVPPHGRLIDADALREDWLENGENEYVYDTNAFLDSLDNAPTIIPAEEGEPSIDEAMAEFAQYCELYEPTYDPETGAM